LIFLDALKSQNKSRPPVWLMRQAGRYLPEYRELRKKHTLRELFFTPELAAEITLMPVDLIGVDAAILFSDITVVALALGYTLDFSEGPVIYGEYKRQSIDVLEPIFKTIQLIKPQLKVPLIGFCGGPYTVASYINGDPALLDPITDVTIEYIQMQEKAGVDAIQIFDSWADRLTDEEFQKYCVPYLSRLIEATTVPVILFMRGACFRVDELVKLKPSAISFDSAIPLAKLRSKVPMAVQGNLDPDLLYEPLSIISQKTNELLDSMRNDPGFIVNLGHGVKPDVPVDAVRCLVDTVREYIPSLV
jgi:uroporphyrinogen decarboxylase